MIGWCTIASALVAQNGATRLEVRDLDFRGNDAIDDLTLRISIVTSASTGFGRKIPVLRWLPLGETRYLNEREFRRDVIRLLLLYRRSGYLDARVDTLVDRAPDHVSITFDITEGAPVRVDSLRIAGVENVLDTARLRRDLPLRVGDPFDRARFAAASDSIRAAVRNRGYPFAEVFRNFDLTASGRRARVDFFVVPGQRARVAAIEVVAPEGTDPQLIRSAMGIRPGELYDHRRLLRSQQDLYRLGVFDFVDVRLKDSLPDSFEDSLVTLRAQVSRGRLHRVRFGAGWGTFDCVRTLGGWTARDLFGGGRSLEVTANLSKIGSGPPFDLGLERTFLCGNLGEEEGSERLNLNANLSATVRFPTLFSTRRSAAVTVSAERFSEFQAFFRTAVGLNLSVTQEIGARLPVTLSYSLSYGRTDADDAVFCSILNVCRTVDADVFREERLKATVGLTVLHDRTNSPLNPTRGSILTLEGRMAAPFTGSDESIKFGKAVAEFASYHPVGRRSVIAWRVRVGSILSPDFRFERQDVRFVPPEERFYGGGPNTQRGFRQNELGPLVHVWEVDSIVRPTDGGGSGFERDTLLRVSPTGGNQMAFASVEYRFPLAGHGRLGGAVFLDAGRVTGQTATHPTRVRVSPGVGLRLFTPLGPVRLDVAYNPHGAEAGPLYLLSCMVTVDGARTCEPELQDLRRVIARPPGDGWFGLAFTKPLQLSFSVGQAF